MTSPVIALAADHAGFELKNSMKVVLEEHGFPLLDLGPETAVLALGARLIGPEVAHDCLLTFLQTPSAGGRHARRVAKIVGARGIACALNLVARQGMRTRFALTRAALATVALTGQAGVHWFIAERAKEERSSASPDLTAANWVSPTGVPVRAT